MIKGKNPAPAKAQEFTDDINVHMGYIVYDCFGNYDVSIDALTKCDCCDVALQCAMKTAGED